MLTLPLRQVKIHAIVGGMLLGYLILFDELYPTLGSGVAALGVIPVALIGGAYGIVPGLLSGVLLTLLNMLLLYSAGDAGWRIFGYGGGPGTIAIIFIGGAAGWIHDLVARVREQAHYLATEREALATEIVARQHVEQALRASQQKLSLHMIQTPLAYIEWSMQFEVVEWNAAAEQIFGFTHDEAVGQHALQLIVPTHVAPAVQQVWQRLLTNGDGKRSTHENVTKDQRVIICEWYNTPLVDHDGQVIGVVSLAQDITERTYAETQLLHAAVHDQLTGLPNRALLLERLGRAMLHAKGTAHPGFAVLFLDLDRFKVVNDSLGHIVGDQLLIGIARRMEACVRPGDTIARLGGDEFALLLEGIEDPTTVTRIADRIQQEVGLPFTLRGYEVCVTASIGIAFGSAAVSHPEDLLRNADSAMYRAKHQGKACSIIFDETMYAHTLALLELETDLRHAIEREEFELYYQPVIAVETGVIVGCEALIRWHHPRRGLIAPAEFIPVAEETGLIVQLDAWVLRHASAQVKAWHDAGLGRVTVAVNVSARHFKHADLATVTRHVLQITGLDPAYLTLEITESSLMEQVETAITTLHVLKDLGVQLAIDDFGTGYSSLNYLKRFPLTTLKIDRSFVRDLVTNPHDAAITTTIIAMAHHLGLTVIAEGVETELQQAFLHDHGCHLAQGYLISQPLSAADFAEFLCMRGNPIAVKFP